MRSIPRPTSAQRRGQGLRRLLTVVAVLGVAAAAELVVATSGSAARQHAPIGHLDSLVQDGRDFYVRGWAYDPDTSAVVKLRVLTDGGSAKAVWANDSRPDVAKSNPAAGPNRGFVVRRAVAQGFHRVCADALDPVIGGWTRIGCLGVVITHNPAGHISWLTQTPGHLRVTGWAVDNDSPTSTRTVAIRVDNREVVRGPADRGYAGFADAHPLAGGLHGYSFTIPLAEGSHSICAKVANTGAGLNTIVQCVSRTVSYSPSGQISTLRQVPGGVSVAGWATDPDTTAPTSVTVTADGTTLGTVTAADAGGSKPGHGFHAQLRLPGSTLAPGARTICALARNLGAYGSSRNVACVRKSFNWNPGTAVEKVAQQSPGATVTGWAVDPDTSAPVSVAIMADGKKAATVTANGVSGSHPHHMFTTTIPLADGKHTICAVAGNLSYGSGSTTSRCVTVSLHFEPYGGFESVARATNSTDVVATGWAIDPDTTGAIPVHVNVDGSKPTTGTASVPRPDIAKKHPGTGSAHGFAVTVKADEFEHRICASAVNVLGGAGTTQLGCKIINAVHPTPASAPRSVTAVGGYGGAHITWTAPATDGGAPWSGYTVRALPSGPSVRVGAGILSTTVLGLKPSTTYSFSVVATNVAGTSPAGTSAAVTTQKEPPAQTSPAPISTSRYIRNVSGASSTDLATMRGEGAADARANPSGHGYLIVLAVGGQDESRKGVILSATIRFVSYSNMMRNLEAYIDGYASQQRPSAPVTIAVNTNNDIDVYRASGVSFANNLVDPVVAYARRYPGITVAGSNDMEPGFRASYAASRAWLQGYMSATSAPFVFTGSADGCAWTVPNRSCNNGWNMSGLYYVSGGAAPIRMVNLPQIYNTTMAQQWRYISLTGVLAGQPKINFGGALTEWTACRQARSCGSLTGNSAWTAMWNQLRAEPRLRPSSLPYSTDLRIDS